MDDSQICCILLVLLGGVKTLPTWNLRQNLKTNISFPYSNSRADYQKWLSVIRINLNYNNSNNNDVYTNSSNSQVEPVNNSEGSTSIERPTSSGRLKNGPTVTTKEKKTWQSETGIIATTERPNSSVKSVNNISIIKININYNRSNNNSLFINI